MAIILTELRPAIDIIQGSYTRPEAPWGHLGDLETRGFLQAAIPAVCRYGFVVGPNLILTPRLIPGQFPQLSPRDKDGKPFEISFGYEVIPPDSIRIEIDELVYSNEKLDIQLVRAAVPAGIEPLRFSVLEPQTLTDREVVLIGYPSSDSRNDPEVARRIFGDDEKYGRKRLMPGRITGFSVPSATRSTVAERGMVLEHDVTTLGGCGSAPLIDTLSGEVLGIHFAGAYLQTNYAISAWEIARDPEFARLGVHFTGPLPTPARVSRTTQTTVVEPVDPKRLETIELKNSKPGVINDDFVDEDADVELTELERIILEDSRPAFPVIGGRPSFSDNENWRQILRQYEARVSVAVSSVGKIFADIPELPWLGSAFVVGDRLALTASYIAERFASGVCGNVQVRSETDPRIDFSDALGFPEGTAVSRITGVRFIHPYFMVALLEIDRLPSGVIQTDLAAQVPANLSGRQIAVVSFGAREPLNPTAGVNSIYGKHSGDLFVQPGEVMQLGRYSGKCSSPAILHDCSTSAGASGAPVLDLGTGYVIGVHVATRALEAGFAVPSWELARDPHIWPHGIRFRPNPQPEWLASWDDESQVNRPDPPPRPKKAQWIDVAPIDWTRKEPRALEQLLHDVVDVSMVPIYLENLQLAGAIRSDLPPQQFWRSVLKTAANAAKLRLLVEEIANDRNYAGISEELLSLLRS